MCANINHYKVHPLLRAPAPLKRLSSSCCGKRGLWHHLVSAAAQGNLARHQQTTGVCSPPHRLPRSGSHCRWGETRSSAESRCSRTREDAPVSTGTGRRPRWRRRQTQRSDSRRKTCACVSHVAAGTRTNQKTIISKTYVSRISYVSAGTLKIHYGSAPLRVPLSVLFALLSGPWGVSRAWDDSEPALTETSLCCSIFSQRALATPPH